MAKHVLLIQVDQMHADCMSCVGHKYVKTPHLDAIAQRGVLFRRAFAQNPICMPSRASLQTSEYLSHCGMFAFGGVLPKRVNYLYDTFKQAGYATGAMGKFHLKCIPLSRWTFDYSAPTLPEDLDFAQPAGNHYDAYCAQHGIKRPNDQVHGHYPDLGVPDPAKYLDARAPSKADPTKDIMVQWHAESDVPEPHSLEAYTADRCIDFLEQYAPAGKSLFAFCSFDRPHYPCCLPAEWFAKMDPESIELEDFPNAEQLAKHARTIITGLLHEWPSVKSIDPQDFKRILAAYFTLIEYIDYQIGRLMQKLRDLGMYDDTTIVFVSDHGDKAGYNGWYDKQSRACSPDIARVPMIIAPAPAENAQGIGRTIDEPVEALDIAPTLAGLHGLEIPDSWQGRDLSGLLLRGGNYDAGRAVFCEEYYRAAIYQNSHMLVAYQDNPAEWALYDLQQDLNGRDNLFREPEQQEVRVELLTSLLNHYADMLLGTVEPEDVQAFQAALDNAPGVLPIVGPGSLDGVSVESAWTVIRIPEPNRVVIVPRFDAPAVVFDGEVNYTNRSIAQPYDSAAVQAALMFAIQKLMKRVINNGMFETYREDQSLASSEEIAQILQPRY